MRSSVERPPVWENERARSDGSIDSDCGLLPPDTDTSVWARGDRERSTDDSQSSEPPDGDERQRPCYALCDPQDCSFASHVLPAETARPARSMIVTTFPSGTISCRRRSSLNALFTVSAR